MSLQFPEDPLSHIKTWQAKFKELKQQAGVAEMDTPGTTKDSRENLHDTKHAIDTLQDWRTFWKEVLDETDELMEKGEEVNKKKADVTNYFADTICLALEVMTGEEVFDCFFEAVKDHYEYIKREHQKAKDLFDLCQGS